MCLQPAGRHLSPTHFLGTRRPHRPVGGVVLELSTLRPSFWGTHLVGSTFPIGSFRPFVPRKSARKIFLGGTSLVRRDEFCRVPGGIAFGSVINRSPRRL